jgi:methylenetetrahydrofolate reductase (NADPH)
MLNNLAKEFLNDFSVEVTPKVYINNRDFITKLFKNKRIFIAHIEGIKTADIVETAKMIEEDGNIAVPHLPARQVENKIQLENRLELFKKEAGVREVLLIAGSNKKPYGDYDSSIQLIESGYFNSGFETIYFAAHPEGNKDIENAKFDLNTSLKLKKDFTNKTDAKVVLVTQFGFDIEQIISWAKTLSSNGIDLPIHIGVAGPAKLSKLIKYSIDCGIGPSLKILESNFSNINEMITTYSPNDFLNDLIEKTQLERVMNIENIHFYPFGGIKELIKSIKN